jgi:uncharacterized membrane protein
MNFNNPVLIGLIIGIIVYIFLYYFNNKNKEDTTRDNIIISSVIGIIICIIWYIMTHTIAVKSKQLADASINKISEMSHSQFIGDIVNKLRIPTKLPNIKF